MTAWALLASVLAGLGALCLLAISIRRPDLHVWPPGDVGSVQWGVVWGLTLTAFAGIAVVGVAEWNAWDLPAWLRWGIGAPLIVVGNVLAWWGVATIGVRNATGAMEGDLARTGIYRYSRNPQYVGDIAILAGWVLLAASTQVLLATLPGIACFLLAPIPEERALSEKFGEAYEEYRENVPRFL